MVEAASRRDNESCDKLNGIVERLGRNVDHILHSHILHSPGAHKIMALWNANPASGAGPNGGGIPPYGIPLGSEVALLNNKPIL